MAEATPVTPGSKNPTSTLANTMTSELNPKAQLSSQQVPKITQPLNLTEISDVVEKLRETSMFNRCNPEELHQLAKHMYKQNFTRGEILVSQNEPADRLLIMAKGYARRLRIGQDGVERYMDSGVDPKAINSLHVTAGEPVYASAKCVTQSCVAYGISRNAFRKQLEAMPKLSTNVIESLSNDVRTRASRFRTPLLSQRNDGINYSAVTVAATAESYYRSALNSVLNQRLSGQSSPLFPNMHVQVPARIVYIAGFKGLRALFDKIDPDQWSTHPARVAVRFATTIAPGIVMTPISSILEASNVGHANPEPLLQRATRGLMPRGGREIIFGVGLNQLSDYCEERYQTVTNNTVVSNTAGSLTAGVVAGYFSHVPHNISTFKLMNPHKPYSELFKMFVDKSVPDYLLSKRIPAPMMPYVKGTLACLFPRGVLVRTVQICGSFALLNGIIQLIERDNRRRWGKSYAEPDEEILEETEEKQST